MAYNARVNAQTKQVTLTGSYVELAGSDKASEYLLLWSDADWQVDGGNETPSDSTSVPIAATRAIEFRPPPSAPISVKGSGTLYVVRG